MQHKEPGCEPTEPTDAEHRAVLDRLIECYAAWEPLACVLGDVRSRDAIAALLWALSGQRPMPDTSIQPRVEKWILEAFGKWALMDRTERGDRLLEEVFELLQSGGYDPSRIAHLQSHVFGRPAGDPVQEVGGVVVTLAGYCTAHGINMNAAGEAELARVWTCVDKIRAKQAAKAGIVPDTPAPDEELPIERRVHQVAEINRELLAKVAELDRENERLKYPLREAVEHANKMFTAACNEKAKNADLRNQIDEARQQNTSLTARVAELEAALSAIQQYGSDTLSGRADGPDDRKWQRDAVLEMTKRARVALSAPGKEPTSE